MSKKALVVYYGAAVAGREDEFNSWYEKVHIPELFEYVSEISAATRYRGSDPSSGTPAESLYYNVFEVDADEPNDVLEKISSVAASGRFQLTDAMAPGWKVMILDRIAQRVTRPLE